MHDLVMTGESELAQIRRFLESRGVTKCRTAYAGPTSTNFSAAEEARRLERVEVKTATRRAILVAARNFHMSVRPF